MPGVYIRVTLGYRILNGLIHWAHNPFCLPQKIILKVQIFPFYGNTEICIYKTSNFRKKLEQISLIHNNGAEYALMSNILYLAHELPRKEKEYKISLYSNNPSSAKNCNVLVVWDTAAFKPRKLVILKLSPHKARCIS